MASTPESVVRTWFEELWNQGKEETIDRFLAPEGLLHGLPTASGQPLKGPAEFKPFYRQFRGAFPDIRITVARMVTKDQTVVAHCHVTGTHRGDTLGMPATNRSIEFWGFAMGDVVDGRIVEGWNCFDFLTMYQQLGVVPALLVQPA